MSALSLTVEDGVAVVVFDLPGEPVNKFSQPVKDEFLALFDRLEGDPEVRAAVLISGKADAFIAGADIEEFLRWTSAAQAEGPSSTAKSPAASRRHCATDGLDMGAGMSSHRENDQGG
jgi:enoyl-CoA hydratase/carnithine racemase